MNSSGQHYYQLKDEEIDSTERRINIINIAQLIIERTEFKPVWLQSL